MAQLAMKGGSPLRTKPFPSWPVYDDAERNALIEVLESRKWGTLGPKVVELENRFAAYIGTRYAQTVCNGTVSLEAVLRALGIGLGDEVLVPPYTFIATVSSVLMVNATPIFVDIDPETNCMDPDCIEEAITPHTRALIVVHMAGLPADMDRICSIASRHGLFVIEDAAQAHGSEWRGKKVGSIGGAGSFSFQLSKNMSAGEGGMITTNDTELAEKCWSIHHVGRLREGEWYAHYRLSSNYRMTDWQAAVLLVQLGRLDTHIGIREQNAAYLGSLLSKLPGVSLFKRDERVTRHTYHLFMFRFDGSCVGGLSKEKFVAALNAEGIPAAEGYVELYKQPLFRDPAVRKILCRQIDYEALSLPNTARACKETVWLPQYLLLGDRMDMEDIAAAVSKVIENAEELR